MCFFPEANYCSFSTQTASCLQIAASRDWIFFLKKLCSLAAGAEEEKRINLATIKPIFGQFRFGSGLLMNFLSPFDQTVIPNRNNCQLYFSQIVSEIWNCPKQAQENVIKFLFLCMKIHKYDFSILHLKREFHFLSSRIFMVIYCKKNKLPRTLQRK